MNWEFGKTLQSASIPGYRFTETQYSGDVRLSPHRHDFAYLCFVVEGTYLEEIHGNEFEHSRFSVVAHPPSEMHANRFLAQSRCFNIQLSDTAGGKPGFDLQQRSVHRGVRLNYLASELYREFLHADEFSDIASEGLMLEIKAELLRHHKRSARKRQPRWLKRIREHLDNFPEENFSVTELAARERMHPTHTAREFRRFYGVTIGDYVRRKRIESACKQLTDTDLPISEIAVSNGFFDQSHFTRIFRRITGTTPAKFRSTHFENARK